MPEAEWWEAPSSQSEAKTNLVVEYFQEWARVMAGNARAYSSWPDRFAYVDLFAGRGFYDDDTPSTPLRVIERATELDGVADLMDVWLNDAEEKYYRELSTALDCFDAVSGLSRPPRVTNYDVSPEVVAQYVRPRPATLFFLDPWGYRGLSLDLIARTVRAKGSECILFFNFNRINMGVSNSLVMEHMEALFGPQRAAAMVQDVESMTPDEREEFLMEQAHLALKEVGGRYPLDFQFLHDQGNRTSHYIIHVCSRLEGHTIMKHVMRKQSSPSDDGIATFLFDPTKHQQKRMELFDGHSKLADELMESFPVDEPVTMGEIYERHQFGTRYIPGDYKQALNVLEHRGAIDAVPPMSDRPKRHGKPTFADHVKVTFLPRKGDQDGRLKD